MALPNDRTEPLPDPLALRHSRLRQSHIGCRCRLTLIVA